MVAINVPRLDDTADATGRDGTAPRWPRSPGRAPATPRGRGRLPPDRSVRIRRRRLVALLIGVLLVAAAPLAATTVATVTRAGGGVEPSSPQPVPAPAPAGSQAPPTAGETYVVQPGDTLWSIAAAIAPDRDPRPVVDALRRVNGGPTLQPGQRLLLELG